MTPLDVDSFSLALFRVQGSGFSGFRVWDDDSDDDDDDDGEDNKYLSIVLLCECFGSQPPA